MLRGEVWGLYSRIYSGSVSGGSEDGHNVASADMFRAFMICAVAAVMPYRNGEHHQHPEGYYLAALRHLDSQLLARGTRSIEDLLLICRFGIYHNIGELACALYL